jgi:uncharacterized protein (DUF4415 family)
MFAWDPAKRLSNLRKHGIDFVDAEEIFRGFTLPFARLRNMKRVTTSRRSLTKLPKLRKLADVAIIRDRDAPEWAPEMFARAIARRGLKPVPKKALLSLRVDSDVISWFREQGAGYQSRMNALLRAYMEAHKQDAP